MVLNYLILIIFCGCEVLCRNINSGENEIVFQHLKSGNGTEVETNSSTVADNTDTSKGVQLYRRRRRCVVTPYDVDCHGICPGTFTNAFKFLEVSWNCNATFADTKYHCAKNSVGKFVEACASPIRCAKGTEPMIKFPPGHEVLGVIECRNCSEDRYNPYEGKLSNTFSVCEKGRQVCKPKEGKIECDIVTSIKRKWTDSKCMCDVRKNFIPLLKENVCTDDKGLRCEEHPPCPDNRDGNKQEYLLSDFSCAPICDEGYHRSYESDDCIQERNDVISNVTLEISTDRMDLTTVIVSVKPINSTMLNDTTVTDLPTDDKDPDPEISTKGLDKGYLIGGIIGGIIGIIGIIFFVICCYKCLKNSQREDTTGSITDPEGMLMITDKRKDLDRDDKKKVLEGCIIEIKMMDTSSVIDQITKHSMFTSVQRKDLQKMDNDRVVPKSEINHKIWLHVHENVKSYYEEFKQCLKDAGCKDLLNSIKKKEDEVLNAKQETNGNRPSSPEFPSMTNGDGVIEQESEV